MKALVLKELSVKQKLGLVHTPLLGISSPEGTLEYLCEQARAHALGAVWIQWDEAHSEKILGYIEAIKAAADYPIAIITDAEAGLLEYKVGKHNAIGCTGSEAHAYAFGKATAIAARALGYNVICNPLLDISYSGSQRSYGSDIHEATRLAAAEARGIHDGGVLTIGKHYPGGKNEKNTDSHMAESLCEQTEEELWETGGAPYLALIEENLLDGVMIKHQRFLEIDNTAPATLSKKMHDILRTRGFDGVMITDALCMMGIRAKYGRKDAMGLAVEAGNDFALMYDDETALNQNALYECYECGIISDNALDAAVERILALHHKIALLDGTAVLSDKEAALVNSIDADSVYAALDEGLSIALPRDGKYYFALMVRNETALGNDDRVQVDTFSNGWHFPQKIKDKITELFPNSHVELFYQFPTQGQNARILTYSLDYDDVIFLTFTEALAYTGAEHLTRRVETLISSMQSTDRISTLIHFGNPTVLGNLPHIPRIIFGGCSEKSTLATLEVLAGDRAPQGKPTYEIPLA